jgi:VIT1/CCC1 family predicted Fe2+/Mn2+ transporter
MEKHVNHTSELLAKRAAQVQRGGARAAVLGVNDGLVSTLCIVIGVAATGAEAKTVLIAGFAGLLAGAISMAAGEWISIRAQVELFQGVLHDLRSIIKSDKELLATHLAQNFQDHGIDEKTAIHAAKDVAKDDAKFVSMYSSQIIGVNEDELGSPWIAAISSFLLFTAGSLAPLAPWVFGLHGALGIGVAIVLTAIGGLFVGGFSAKTSGKGIVFGAFRQLLIVVFAAAITYGIGHIFGAAIS